MYHCKFLLKQSLIDRVTFAFPNNFHNMLMKETEIVPEIAAQYQFTYFFIDFRKVIRIDIIFIVFFIKLQSLIDPAKLTDTHPDAVSYL